MGTQLPNTKNGTDPKFSPHVYYAQTARRIEMILGTEVGLDLSDIVLDGDSAPLPPKGAESPNFRSMSNVANGCMYQDATCTKVGLGPGYIVLDGDTAPRSQKGVTVPNFRPVSIVAKRLHGSR